MITPKSIEALLERVKIEDVVGDYVQLKRRGVNLIGLCPFHSEKTPSFTVSVTKNLFKCFGCGQGGDAITFLMEHEHLSYPEAIRQLARKYNFELEETVLSEEANQQKMLKESHYLVNEFARDFFSQQLLQTDKGKSIGLSYFRSRGFTPNTIEKFELGYAPDEKDLLTRTAIGKGFTKPQLESLKLTNSFGYDFFRDRVMFTIHNLSGKVVGFAGRIMKNDPKAPKYINSPETEIYLKSKILYGAHLAKKAISKEDSCFIVEGYTDVISLHQAGIENVVASSGTSLTVDQIGLIKRYTNKVVILFDGDSAGIKAALRGLDLVLEQGLNVKVVLLPDGEDPDGYVRKVGGDAFKSFIQENAKDFIFFKTGLLLDEAGKDPVKKSEMIRSIVESIAKIPDPLTRSVYVQECSRKVGFEEQVIINEVNKIVSQQFKKEAIKVEIEHREVSPFTSKLPDQTPVSQKDAFQEKDLVRILVSGGSQIFDPEKKLSVAQFVIQQVEDILDEFEHPLYKKVVQECFDIVSRGDLLSPGYFTAHKDDSVRKLAIDLITSPYEYSENWEKKWEIFLQTQKMPDENFYKDSLQAILRFRLKKIIAKCEENVQLIAQYDQAGDFKKVLLHMKVQQKLDEMKREISKELGSVIL